MNALNTTNPNSYEYHTKHLQVNILGGMKTNKLESLRITMSIQKPESYNVLRHSLDLYNDNQVEKFTRKIAERLEIGTSVTRRTLQDLTRELENHRFLLLEKEASANAPYQKVLSAALRRVLCEVCNFVPSTVSPARYRKLYNWWRTE